MATTGEPGSAPPTRTTLDAAALSADFTMIDAAAVNAFLDRHPGLVGTILAAKDTLRRFFPEEPLRLDVARDPEYPADRQIEICVVTHREVDDALNQLDRFDDEWLAIVDGKADDHVLVTLAFV